MKYIKVKTLRKLDNLIDDENGLEVFISLAKGSVRSSKHIYKIEGGKYQVFNWIDDSEQELSREELLDESVTNIGLAMKLGSLFALKN